MSLFGREQYNDLIQFHGHFHLGVQIWPATNVLSKEVDGLKPALVLNNICSAPILLQLLIPTYGCVCGVREVVINTNIFSYNSHSIGGIQGDVIRRPNYLMD